MIIVLNNKSNIDKYQFLDYQEIIGTLDTNSKIILCPTFLNINLCHLRRISLGSQNVSSHENGAFTGEVSAKDLKVSGVEYAIVGHSERRENQNETDEEIHEKILRLFEYDMIPILCIGETKEERERGEIEQVLTRELDIATRDLTDIQKSRMLIAYEPVWSIGTGLIPTLNEIDDVIKMIKTRFPNTKVLYGGSANEKNVDMLKQSTWIDGYLVGGLSMKTQELQVFINKLENR